MGLDIITTGYPSLDYILRVTHAPQPGETGIVLDAFKLENGTLGGCPTNIAVACSRLGLQTCVIIPVGNDVIGKQFRSALEQEGVNTQLIQVIEGANTSYSFLFIDPESKHQTFFYPGVGDRNDLQLRKDNALAVGTRWGIITAGNAAYNLAIIDWFNELNIPILWSPKIDEHSYPQPLIEKLARDGQIAVMNEAEASFFQKKLNLPDIKDLFNLNTKVIFITSGSHGSRVISPDDEEMIPAVSPEKAIDPTGAGDAYTSGVIFGLYHGLKPRIAARIGAVVSSFVLEKWGCQTNLPNFAKLEKRYKMVFNDALTFS